MTTTQVLEKIRRYQPIATIVDVTFSGKQAIGSLYVLEALLVQYNPKIDDDGWIGYTSNIEVETDDGFWNPAAEIEGLILWLKETKPLFQNHLIIHSEFVKSIMWFQKANSEIAYEHTV